MKSAEGLIEKKICAKCGIVFTRALECPRCGKSDAITVYFELGLSKDLIPEDNIIRDGVRDPEQA
jgi:hypothetical protein